MYTHSSVSTVGQEHLTQQYVQWREQAAHAACCVHAAGCLYWHARWQSHRQSTKIVERLWRRSSRKPAQATGVRQASVKRTRTPSVTHLEIHVFHWWRPHSSSLCRLSLRSSMQSLHDCLCLAIQCSPQRQTMLWVLERVIVTSCHA